MGILAALVGVLGALSFWLAQSHTIQAQKLSVVLLLVPVLYTTIQLLGAFLACLNGLTPRPAQPALPTAQAYADVMDLVKETLRATRFNEDQTDDRISQKALCLRFLKNAAWGFGIAAVIAGAMITYNFQHMDSS